MADESTLILPLTLQQATRWSEFVAFGLAARHGVPALLDWIWSLAGRERAPRPLTTALAFLAAVAGFLVVSQFRAEAIPFAVLLPLLVLGLGVAQNAVRERASGSRAVLEIVTLVVGVGWSFAMAQRLGPAESVFSGFINDELRSYRIELLNGASIAMVLAGAIWLSSGATLVVRAILEEFQVQPRAMGADDGTRTYNRGRIIGTFERLLVFVFVLVDGYAAAGLLVTAKGWIRAHGPGDQHGPGDTDRHREHAEYFLIGTLTSLLLAIGTGIAVGWVLDSLPSLR